MTQDEIIDMAIQAGASPDENKIWLMYAEEIEAFANLVAAEATAVEREACAKIVAYNCTCGRTMKFESVHGVVAPQRTWVGLTNEDISEIVRGTHNTGSFVRAIEAKLKEKNKK